LIRLSLLKESRPLVCGSEDGSELQPDPNSMEPDKEKNNIIFWVNGIGKGIV